MLVSKSLNVFIALAEEGSYQSAAKRLFLTPTPLLRMVKKIEEDLGMVLFTSAKNGIRLTQYGVDFYKKVSPLYYELNDITKVKEPCHISIFTNNPQYGVLNHAISFLSSTGNFVSVITEPSPTKMYDIYVCNFDMELPYFYKKKPVQETILTWSGERRGMYRGQRNIVQSGFFSSTIECQELLDELKGVDINVSLIANDLVKTRFEMVSSGVAITLGSECDINNLSKETGVKLFPFDSLSFPGKVRFYIKKHSNKFNCNEFCEFIDRVI
ncbi:LysR family transcriptional regulator [Serratia quinivorans]|uniref:helix-turn-helix domain-containing protein n=1 Tax=Serratia quinivorans TaxID=137545 RepID=UPI002E78A9F5|nr:LysR family transcriptional regulator [Serratia quinivorans]